MLRSFWGEGGECALAMWLQTRSNLTAIFRAQPQPQVLKNQRLREMCELPPQCFTETSVGADEAHRIQLYFLEAIHKVFLVDVVTVDNLGPLVPVATLRAVLDSYGGRRGLVRACRRALVRRPQACSLTTSLPAAGSWKLFPCCPLVARVACLHLAPSGQRLPLHHCSKERSAVTLAHADTAMNVLFLEKPQMLLPRHVNGANLLLLVSTRKM